MNGFDVYVVELIDSVEICVARNIHKRTQEDIEKVCTCIPGVQCIYMCVCIL